MDNFKLTRQQYLSLWDKDIKKSDYDKIVSQIDSRFSYIMETICTKLEWFDYDNGWEETSGHFEINNYNKLEDSYINFNGDYSAPEPYNSCPDIPIKWLWEDFEREFNKEVAAAKLKKENDKNLAKLRREQRKVLRAKTIESIKSKLTKEELKFVKFK